MEYKINNMDLFSLSNQLTMYKISLEDIFSQLQQALAELGETTDFKGETANALKNFINEVHLSLIIPALSQSILQIEMNLSIYYAEYKGIDSNIRAVLQQDTLEDTAETYDGHLSHFLDLYDGSVQVVNGISDVISVSVPASTSVEQTITGITDSVREVDELAQAIESKYYTQFQNTYDLLSSIHDLMKRYAEYDADRVAGYQSGDCVSGIEFERLKEDIIASCQYTTSAEGEYKKSLDARKETYDILVQERKEEAKKQIIESIKDALCVAGGVAVIFLSGGTATPIVVVSGVSRVVYDASNAYEGIQSYQLAQAGDIYTVAGNLIRDSIFFGHQGIYDLWGDLSGTAFSMSVPFSCGENKVNNIKNLVSEYAMDKAFETVSNSAFVEYSRVTGEELSDIQKEIIQGSYDLLGMTFDVGKAYAGHKAKKQKLNADIRKSETAEVSRRQNGNQGNKYCLTGAEHYEAYKEMFGAENVEWTSRNSELNMNIGQENVPKIQVPEQAAAVNKGLDIHTEGNTVSRQGNKPTEQELKYEEYWKQVEAGKNTGHPGLTEADIKAWEYADRKVNEHIVMDKVDSDAVIQLRGGNGAKEIESGSKTIITPEMEEKILLGQRKNPAKNELIGGHSPNINNANPNYAVEVLQTNPDGTQKIKFVTQYDDGNLSNIKTSTIFPDSWSDDKITESIKAVGDSSPIGVRTSDGAMLYRETIDGVQIEVIKIGDTVTSGYPTGSVKTGLLPGFNSLE